MADQNLMSTPKRKRADSTTSTDPQPTYTDFTFQVQDGPIGGASSPRSRVAQRFQQLAIGGGGGEHKLPSPPPPPPEVRSNPSPSPRTTKSDSPRKRAKHLPMTQGEQRKGFDFPLTGQPKASEIKHSSSLFSRATLIPTVGSEADRMPDDSGGSSYESNVKSFPIQSLGQGAKAATASMKTSEAVKAQDMRRSGTPPLIFAAGQLIQSQRSSVGQNKAVVEPVRAALTWREDEITVYDPHDQDDDGTGINGIGFKPTPAIAYARALKRRQQLVEYRKREDKEARARRSQRRHESPVNNLPKTEIKDSVPRRVRFADGDKMPLIAAS